MLDIDSPDALALFDEVQLTALYQRGANTGSWIKLKVYALYVWHQHKRDQEDVDLETLYVFLFTLYVMKDLRKTQSRTKEYTRKKEDKDDSYI